MTIVAATTTSTADQAASRSKGLQEWALTRTSIHDHLHAIELVLTHDFDEPPTVPGPRASHDAAQAVRERFLVEATGVESGAQAREPLAYIGAAATVDERHRMAA